MICYVNPSFQDQNDTLRNLLHQKNNLLDQLSRGFIRAFMKHPPLQSHFSAPVFASFFKSHSIDRLLAEVLHKNPRSERLFGKKKEAEKEVIEMMSVNQNQVLLAGRVRGNRKESKSEEGEENIPDNFDVISSGDVGVSRKRLEVQSELSAAGFSEAFNSKKGIV